MALNSQDKIEYTDYGDAEYQLSTPLTALKNVRSVLESTRELVRLTHIVANSFAEDAAKESIQAGIYDDDYEVKYLTAVQEKREGWIREEKNANYFPCHKMEGYYVEAWKRGHCVPLVQHDPDTVWLYKDDLDRMTMITNLATGEVFLPGTELRTYLSKRIENGKGNREIRLDRLPKTIRSKLRIHFTRLVFPLQLPQYREFHELRDRLLHAFCSQKEPTNSIVRA